MARGSADILQLLANPTNRAILTVLAAEPTYPRRLADIVGLTEDEASRRLRQFEKLGIAEAEWANLGKTVRLYKLSAPNITVSVTGSGVTIAGLAERGTVELGAWGETVPVLQCFVGRARELGELQTILDQRGAACVHGIGGAGKTSLAASLASRGGRPVVWHTLAPATSGILLISRLAGAARGLATGDRLQRLMALKSGEEPMLLLQNVVEVLNARHALIVLDRFEGAGEGAGDVAGDLAKRMTNARLLITSRVFPKELPRDRVASFKLEGLALDESTQLLAALAPVPPAPDAARDLHACTRGHPLSLVLLALASGSVPPDASRLAEESGIRDFLMSDVLPQLSEPEREVLLTLSLLRGPFSAEEAEIVCERKHARDALLRLESRGLVVRAGPTFSIHDVVRTFSAEVAPEARKVHARAAKVLLASQEPPKVLEAIHHLLEANDASSAAKIVRDELTERTYRFQDQGLSDGYLAVLERLEQAKSLKPEEHAYVLVELASFDVLRGIPERAHARLDLAARACRRADGSLIASLAIARARLHHIVGDIPAASKAFAAAARAAETSGNKNLLLRALVDHAFCEEGLDDEKARELYRRAIDVGQETSDVRLLSLAYSGAARIAMRAGDAKAVAWMDEALRLARLSGSIRGEASAYLSMTQYAALRRDASAGLEFSGKYLEACTRLGDPWLKACALVDVAFMRVAAGQAEEAAREAETAIAFSRSISSSFYVLGGAVALAEARLALGDPKAAIDAVLALLPEAGKLSTTIAARGWLTVADARERLGDKTGAQEARDRAHDIDPSALWGDPDRARTWTIIGTPGGLNP